eukprot:CAMPEP_0116143148 /NCGR_PEP_ID=MMETSP0329-20121206/15293_1 /TAXON_ID=697910 /ORGANISM="Pseudo-nitzschia arenysensis, Strain B593" /LENGTH=427 /DNA_ID=CAMNT_0003638443 /DNA_START=18 /DNA_END=1301 /DNA_ORIENTATION=+
MKSTQLLISKWLLLLISTIYISGVSARKTQWGIPSSSRITLQQHTHAWEPKVSSLPPIASSSHRLDPIRQLPRGGSTSYGHAGYSPHRTPSPSLVRILGTITQLLVSAGKAVLPPLVTIVRAIAKLYRSLPMDAITAQVGLVYCFLGGYYPTLFSSLQAAKYCGWNIMVKAISDLTEEALLVIDELDHAGVWDPNFNEANGTSAPNSREAFLKQTHIVLTTVDPAKLNTAAGALYTTWLGISTVLRREYARVIQLSLTLAEGMEMMGKILLVPALNIAVPKDYHRWVPVLLGWSTKALAMRVAWRIERVLVAATSAIAGGAMVARSITKLVKRRKKRRKVVKEREMVVADETLAKMNDDDDDPHENPLSVQEQVLGFAVGGLGFYTQIERQYQQRFSFQVPFPMSLVTWPFDLAERWIQWYITEHPN